MAEEHWHYLKQGRPSHLQVAGGKTSRASGVKVKGSVQDLERRGDTRRVLRMYGEL